MRACICADLVLEIAPSTYQKTTMSDFFADPRNRDMFKQMFDFVGQALYKMPRYLRLKGYANPVDYNDGPFQYGHETTLGFWEYLNEEPERIKVFNSGMQSAAAVGHDSQSTELYGFDAIPEIHNLQSLPRCTDGRRWRRERTGATRYQGSLSKLER